VENQAGRVCELTRATQKYMNELPQLDGSSKFQLSDTGFALKLVRRLRGEAADVGETYYDSQGNFYHAGYLKR
jgi:alpha-D-ribose 1-methylphosphonate 5-phosphate C-P lyase